MIQTLFPSMMCVALSIPILLATSETVLYNVPLDMYSLKIAVAGLKMYPLIALFLLHDTKFESIVGAWALGVMTLLLCAAQLRSWEWLTDILLYLLSSTIIYYDSYRQRHSLNKVMSQLQESLELNEKLAVEAQALELRAMIGNVAHDLKTVRVHFTYLTRNHLSDLSFPLSFCPSL